MRKCRCCPVALLAGGAFAGTQERLEALMDAVLPKAARMLGLSTPDSLYLSLPTFPEANTDLFAVTTLPFY